MSEPEPQTSEVVLTVADRPVTLRLPEGDDHLSRQLRSSGEFYERELLDDLVRRSALGDVVVDVGANIGNHTVFLAASGLRVIALEPHPVLFELLRHNVVDNSLDVLVDLRRTAAGAVASAGSMVQHDPSNLGSSAVEPGDEGEVHIERLDDLLADVRVNFVKIDVEGGELAVIEGATAILERDRPVLYVELADAAAERHMIPLLGDLGYRCVGVFNATPTFVFVSESDGEEAIQAAVAGMMRRLHRLERSSVTWQHAHDRALQAVDSRLEQLARRSDEREQQILQVARSTRDQSLELERERRTAFQEQAADLRARLTAAHELAATHRAELIELRAEQLRLEKRVAERDAELDMSWSSRLKGVRRRLAAKVGHSALGS